MIVASAHLNQADAFGRALAQVVDAVIAGEQGGELDARTALIYVFHRVWLALGRRGVQSHAQARRPVGHALLEVMILRVLVAVQIVS